MGDPAPNPPALRPCPEVRAEDLTREAFQEQYVGRNTPVVIRGGGNAWPALETWSLPTLGEKLAGTSIEVTTMRGGEASVGPMELGSFFGRIQGTPEDVHYYLVEKVIVFKGNRPGPLAALDEDLERIPWYDPTDHIRTAIFAGHDTRSVCHYHPGGEAILTQVLGEKRVRLFSPEGPSFYALYPRPWYTYNFNFSRIDFPRDGGLPDTTGFPRFGRATGFDCELEPGDMCYIPVFWWHVAFGRGVSVSVAEFWNSTFRQRHLTLRGLRSNTMNLRRASYFARSAKRLVTGKDPLQGV